MTSFWPAAQKVFTASPVLLFEHGEYRDEALRRNRLTRAEVLQAVRGAGNGDMNAIAAVVLEGNGKFSIISADQLGSGSALHGVKE